MKKLKPLKLLVQEAKTISHKKYSNETIFERRVKEREQDKELISTKKNSTSTISNFFKYKNSLPHITSSTLAQSQKNNNTKYSTSLNSDTIYLTNINFSQTINSDNTISFKKINESNSPNKKFNINIKILNNFEDKLKSQKPKDEKTQIDIKNNTMYTIKERYKEYINKTRDLQLLRYSMNIKQENVIRLKEAYQNKIKSLDESIQSLNVTKKLFNEQFYNKFDFYVKYLFIRKENEKDINNELLKQIIQLKSEIYQIETKIQKQEMDKNNIIRWLYFQISVKEKFIELPSYYKILIEENDLSFQDKTPKKRESKISEESSKTLFRKNSQFKKINKKLSKKLRFSKIHLTGVNFSSTLKTLPQSEIERIKTYRIKPPFTTVDSFIETIKKYEDINIYKIKVYNELRDDLRYLKMEKRKFQKLQKEEDDIQNKEINEKIIQLNRLIEKNNILLKEKTYCLNLKNQSSFDLNYKYKRIKRFDLSHSKPRLKEHVQQLYSTCQLMDFDKIISPEIFTIKKIKTKEEEILDMLTKIEIVIVYIKNQFSLYNNSNGIYYDTYKKVMSVIDKDHKIAKAKRQREKEMIKLKKKMEQIEEKSKKLYFLPYRKTNDYLKYENNNENKKYYDDDNIYREPVLEDFLYDINDKRSHSEERKRKKKRNKTINK